MIIQLGLWALNYGDLGVVIGNTCDWILSPLHTAVDLDLVIVTIDDIVRLTLHSMPGAYV